MNRKNVETLIKRIKTDLASLEKELLDNNASDKSGGSNPEIDKDYKNMRYHVRYNNEEHGGNKGFTKRDVFRFIVSEELKSKSVEELNKIFALKYFPKIGTFAAYPYVIEEKQLPDYPKSAQKKYLNLTDKGSNKNIYILGEWAQFGNIQEQTPGNFPILMKIVKKLGYKITEVKR